MTSFRCQESQSIAGVSQFSDCQMFEDEQESVHAGIREMLGVQAEHLLPLSSGSQSTHLSNFREKAATRIHAPSSIFDDCETVSRLAGIVTSDDESSFLLQAESSTKHTERSEVTKADEKDDFEDFYMESLHSRLNSSHFRRDERSEDYIDFLFEKIEAIACEMDGEPETIRDILDDVFEFLEDSSCGKTSRGRKAFFRRSFESFLQKIDRLAALAPKEMSIEDENQSSKDLLDILCHHFEKIWGGNSEKSNSLFGQLFNKELMSDIAEYFQVFAGQREESKKTGSRVGAPADLPTLLSESDDSCDSTHHKDAPLAKISEEGSLSSDQCSSKKTTPPKKVDEVRLRSELVRRHDFRRLRGNIHGHVSSKAVVEKVVECCDSVNEAFESAGEQISSAGYQLSTIFEGVELEKLWETFTLGASTGHSNASQNQTVPSVEMPKIESDELHNIFDGEMKMIEPDPQRASATLATEPTELEQPKLPEAIERSLDSDQEGVSLSISDKQPSDVSPEYEVVEATSSEDTFASGCGSRRSGTSNSCSSSKRFQQVNEMRKFEIRLKNKIGDAGRLTPNSNATEQTCDETISVKTEYENDNSGRNLKLTDSNSSRIGKMEMLVYLSMQESTRKARTTPEMPAEKSVHLPPEYTRAKSLDAVVSKESPEHSEHVVSQTISLDDLSPSWMIPSFPPRLEEAPDDVFLAPSKFNRTSSFDGKAPVLPETVSSVELDAPLGRASNRSNRSLFVQDSGSISAYSVDEMPSIPYIPTAESEDGEEEMLAMKEQRCLVHMETSDSEGGKRDLRAMKEHACLVLTDSSHESSAGGSDSFLSAEDDENQSMRSRSSTRSRLQRARAMESCAALEDSPDDEVHRVDLSRAKVPATLRGDPQPLPKASSVSVDMIPAGQSWIGMIKALFIGSTTTGGKWIGNQALKVLMLLLYVSVSIASPANDTVKERIAERRRRLDEKIMQKKRSRTVASQAQMVTA